MSVSDEVLRRSSLLSREADYLSLPKELPPPVDPGMWAHRPEGYYLEVSEKKKEYNKIEKEKLSEAFVAAAWLPSLPEGPNVDAGSLRRPSYHKWSCRMMKVSRTTLREMRIKSSYKILSGYKGKRYYSYWKECVKPHSRDSIESIPSTPVDPIGLGPSSVWISSRIDVSSDDSSDEGYYSPKGVYRPTYEYDESTLVLLSSRNKVRVYRNGIAIGPPTCF